LKFGHNGGSPEHCFSLYGKLPDSTKASFCLTLGPKGNPTAANLFNVVACLQEHEGVRLQVVA